MIRQLTVAGALCLCFAFSTYAADRNAADALLAGVPELLKNNDFKTVEEFCNRSLQADETCPLAHFYLGVVHENNKKAREALKEYNLAAAIATKEKDTALATKAAAAAKKLGQGLTEIDALDAKFAEKLTKLGQEAFDAGKFDTAKKSYTLLVALQPDNAKAKEALDKTNKAMEERGDPIKAKIAAALLSEIWFKLGLGKKEEAKTLAQNLSSKYPETETGKEATVLLEKDFAVPKADELAQLNERIKQAAAAKPVTPSPAAAGVRVDVEATQRAAEEMTKKLPKDGLVPAFTDAYKKGKEFYSKATPGTAGNQENIAKALEQFIKADALYLRIESEQLTNEELAAQSRDSGLLHYACLKMTILTH